jgi:hypothetical protein
MKLSVMPPLTFCNHLFEKTLFWTIGVIFIFFLSHRSLWDYRRDLSAGDTSIQILKSPFLKTSAPLLEHSYDSYGTFGDICNLHYFLWDYRRDLDTGDTSI